MHKPSVMFSLPSPVAEGSDRDALVDAWCPARVSPQHLHRFLVCYMASNNMHYLHFGLAVTVASPVLISKVPQLSKCYSRAMALTYKLVIVKGNLRGV